MGEINIIKLKSEILREVGALARCIQSISDIKFREIGLQRGQFIFLTRICENAGINLMELSNMLKVDKTTTTKVVQKLMETGYVLKKRSDDDKRNFYLFPSLKAQEVYSYVIQEENRNIKGCFAGFTSEEEKNAYHFLKRMCANIEQDWKKLKGLRQEED